MFRDDCRGGSVGHQRRCRLEFATASGIENRGPSTRKTARFCSAAVHTTCSEKDVKRQLPATVETDSDDDEALVAACLSLEQRRNVARFSETGAQTVPFMSWASATLPRWAW